MVLGWNRADEKKNKSISREEHVGSFDESYIDPYPNLSKTIRRNADGLDSGFAARAETAKKYFEDLNDPNALPCLLKIYTNITSEVNQIVNKTSVLCHAITKLIAVDPVPYIRFLPYLSPGELQKTIEFTDRVSLIFASNIIVMIKSSKSHLANYALDYYLKCTDEVRANNVSILLEIKEQSDIDVTKKITPVIMAERGKKTKKAIIDIVSKKKLTPLSLEFILGAIIINGDVDEDDLEKMIMSPFSTVNYTAAIMAISQKKYVKILPLLDKAPISSDVTEYLSEDIFKGGGDAELFYALLEKCDVDSRLILAAINGIGTLNIIADMKVIGKFLENDKKEIKEVALKTLLKYTPTKEEERGILWILKCDNECLKKWAIDKLIEFHSTETVNELIPLLDSTDHHIVEMVVKGILSYDSFENVDVLKKLSKNKDFRMRLWAMQHLCSSEVFEILVEMQDDESPEIRKTIVANLGKLGGINETQIIKNMVFDEDLEVRKEAVKWLGLNKVVDGLVDLEKLLGNSDPSIRIEIVKAIGLIGITEGLDMLSKLVSDESDSVRQEVAKSLGLVGGPGVAVYLKDLMDDSSDCVSLQAIKSIGLIEQPEIIPSAYIKIKSENPEIRAWAFWILSKSKAPIYIYDMFKEMEALPPEGDVKNIDMEFIVSDGSINNSTLLSYIAKYLEKSNNGAVATAINRLISKNLRLEKIVNEVISEEFWKSKKDLGIKFNIPKKLKLDYFDMTDVLITNPNDFPIVILDIKVVDSEVLKIDTMDVKFHIGPNETEKVKMNILTKFHGEVPVVLKLSLEYLGVKDIITIKQGLKIVKDSETGPTAPSLSLRDGGGKYIEYDNSKQLILGKGGSSTVYCVEKGGKKYAMKLPNMDFGGNSIYIDNDMDAFKKELATWLELSKKVPESVVKLEDYGIDVSPWVVMELAQTDLRTEMKKGLQGDPMDIIISLLLSLQEIHECGICHNDIKPENILLVDGIWKFSDFDRANSACAEGMIIQGTPAYFAPEQISDNYGKPNMATDMWQMGIMICEILTGKLPYEGMNECRTRVDIHALVIGRGPDLREVPEQYKDVLAKVLFVSQDDRIKTPAQLQKELQRSKGRYKHV